MMPHYQCLWNNSPQFAKQRQHSPFLFHSPRILGYTVSRQPTFIAYANGVSIVILAMRPDLFYRSATVNITIARNIEMVTNVLEPPVMNMFIVASLEIQVPPLRGGGTMDNDQSNLTHTG